MTGLPAAKTGLLMYNINLYLGRERECMFILNKKINGNLSAIDIFNSSGWTHCKQGRPHITHVVK